MTLVEHSGPKGQALLRVREDRPVWFSSARDAIAFPHLAEAPKTIRAIYVSDMAKAESWDDPGASNWVEARRAAFVFGSSRRGGMGADEAVPFSDRGAAGRFAAAHGGRVRPSPRCRATGRSAARPGMRSPARARPRRRDDMGTEASPAVSPRLSRRSVLGVLAAAPGLALPGLGHADEAPLVTWRGAVLGALGCISLHHPDRATAERLIAAALDEIRRLEAMFSLWRADSLLRR